MSPESVFRRFFRNFGKLEKTVVLYGKHALGTLPSLLFVCFLGEQGATHRAHPYFARLPSLLDRRGLAHTRKACTSSLAGYKRIRQSWGSDFHSVGGGWVDQFEESSVQFFLCFS